VASPAQRLDLFARAILRLATGAPPAYLPLRTVLGPVDLPPVLEKPVTLPWQEGLGLCRALVQHVAHTGHLPTSLAAGGTAAGPGPLLKGVAAALLVLNRGQEPGSLTFLPGVEEPAAATPLVEKGIYEMVPEWIPHSPQLRLDQLALHMRLQAWSLKPAVLALSV
jgi:hypothetical protein